MKVNDIIGEYTITGFLGDGGMGVVWSAQKDGVDYALKTCTSTEEDDLKRFDREFRLMSSLDHPNVLKAYEKNENEGIPYIVMEKADCNLKDLVEQGLSTKQKFDFVLQTCEGLSYIHKSGESHRDIKTENVFVADGVAKVADFGLGRFHKRDSTTLTATADRWGTYGYAAPELFKEGKFKEGSPLIDIYSLGCLIYNVFSDGSLPQFMNYRMVPADIYPIIKRCTENEPDMRYQTVDEVTFDINHIWNTRNRYASLSALAADRSKLTSIEITEEALSLFYKSSGKEELLANFKVLKTLWTVIYKTDKTSAEAVANYIISVWENDNNYMLKYEDAETLSEMAVLLCPIVSDPSIKICLFDLSLTNAIDMNRYAAQRNIYENLVKKWDENSIKPYTSYISTNHAKIDDIAQCLGVKIPSLVTNLYQK